MEEYKYYKAFIRVVKSIITRDSYLGGFDTVEVIREPIIKAKDKAEVKTYLLNEYPQFFQNNKVYEKETKDQAQFFYVVIFELYKHELDLINEGSWTCDHCGHIHENKYVSRPITSHKFEGKIFCGQDYKSGNDLNNYSCYELWKKDKYKYEELPDDLNYVNENSVNYIYKCTEKSTNKCYIGKTKNAPFFRWWNHLTHSISPFGVYLRTTNLSDWTFEVLEELPCNIAEQEVFKIESKYITQYDSINNGYNSLISSKDVKSKIDDAQSEISFEEQFMNENKEKYPKKEDIKY